MVAVASTMAPGRAEARHAAFDAVYAAHAGPVFRAARRMLGDEEAAADLTQDVFLRAYLGGERLRSAGSARAWLLAVARNAALDRLRRERRHRGRQETATVQGQADTELTAGPEAIVAARETQALVRALIGTLAPQHAALLMAYIRHDLDAAALARDLGITRGHAHVRLCRARQDFRRAAAALVVLRRQAACCSELRALAGDAGHAAFSLALRRAVEAHVLGCRSCGTARRALDADGALVDALGELSPMVS